jgi:hypothetical protein
MNTPTTFGSANRINGIKNRVAGNLSEGLTFGTQNHNGFVPFTVKFLALALPGIALGHYLDQGIFWLQKKRHLGDLPVAYMALQIIVWILMFYSMNQFAAAYAAEFQSSVAGIFFIALFFTVQTNFVTNLQKVLGAIDKEL